MATPRKTPLTVEQIRRTKSAIFETRILIEKEESYPEDLQDKAYIERMKTHLEKLDDMLRNGMVLPVFPAVRLVRIGG